jgi:hypothetical protein
LPSVTFVGISGHVAGILPVTFTGTSVTIPESPVTLVRNTQLTGHDVVLLLSHGPVGFGLSLLYNDLPCLLDGPQCCEVSAFCILPGAIFAWGIDAGVVHRRWSDWCCDNFFHDVDSFKLLKLECKKPACRLASLGEWVTFSHRLPWAVSFAKQAQRVCRGQEPIERELKQLRVQAAPNGSEVAQLEQGLSDRARRPRAACWTEQALAVHELSKLPVVHILRHSFDQSADQVQVVERLMLRGLMVDV